MNSLATFREYMELERRREDGLTPDELERWALLRGKLDQAVGNLEPPVPGQNRRATPRVPTLLEVNFEGIQEIGSVLMTNLSRGGIFVPTTKPVEIGTVLNLRISIEESGTSLTVQGEVVSHHLNPRLEVQAKGMGIRFRNLSSTDQKLVDDLYERCFQRYVEGD